MDRFTEYLASLGHTALTVRGYDDAACHFSAWLQQSGIGIGHAGDDTCAAFATHRCQCPGIRLSDRVSAKYARRARRSVRFLSECGIVGRLTPPGPMPVEPLVSSFQDCLRQHCGTTERTIDKRAAW